MPDQGRHGAGYSRTAIALPAGSDPRALAIGDLNGDGRPDLVAAEQDTDSVAVLLNTTDEVAPVSVDDVPAGAQDGPVAVHLSATDPGPDASGVASILYTVGTDPVDPADPAKHPSTYDPASPPALQPGERIRYFATDQVGNAEAPHASAAVPVASAPLQSAVGPVSMTTGPTAPPTLSPSLSLAAGARAKAAQLLLNKHALTLHAGCGPVPCAIALSSRVRLGARTAGSLSPARATLRAGEVRTLRLGSSAALRARVRHDVRRDPQAKVTITITATFTAPGAPAVRRELTIRLRRLVR